jgi:hypothetical protein
LSELAFGFCILRPVWSRLGPGGMAGLYSFCDTLPIKYRNRLFNLILPIMVHHKAFFMSQSRVLLSKENQIRRHAFPSIARHDNCERNSAAQTKMEFALPRDMNCSLFLTLTASRSLWQSLLLGTLGRKDDPNDLLILDGDLIWICHSMVSIVRYC